MNQGWCMLKVPGCECTRVLNWKLPLRAVRAGVLALGVASLIVASQEQKPSEHEAAEQTPANRSTPNRSPPLPPKRRLLNRQPPGPRPTWARRHAKRVTKTSSKGSSATGTTPLRSGVRTGTEKRVRPATVRAVSMPSRYPPRTSLTPPKSGRWNPSESAFPVIRTPSFTPDGYRAGMDAIR